MRIQLRRVALARRCQRSRILNRSWSRSNQTLIAKANTSLTWPANSVQTMTPLSNVLRKMWRLVLTATPQSKSRFTLPARTALSPSTKWVLMKAIWPRRNWRWNNEKTVKLRRKSIGTAMGSKTLQDSRRRNNRSRKMRPEPPTQ